MATAGQADSAGGATTTRQERGRPCPRKTWPRRSGSSCRPRVHAALKRQADLVAAAKTASADYWHGLAEGWRKAATASRIGAITKLARGALLVDPAEFDTHADLLNAPNPYTFRKPHEHIRDDNDRRGDPTLRERVKTDKGERAAAMLAWLVAGAMRWYAGEPGRAPMTHGPAPERSDGAAGHLAVHCNAAPGCRSVWYRPPHEPRKGRKTLSPGCPPGRSFK